MYAKNTRLAARLLPLLATAYLACGQAATTPLIDKSLPINLDAQSSDFDYRNNLLRFHHVRISQGATAVESDEATATGLSFDNSHWDFRGHVRITLADGALLSDVAVVEFAHNAPNSAVITGNPATFEQKREQCVAKGHAGRINYDFTTQTIRLSEQASISYGDGQINGRTLIYSIQEQRVLANPEDQDNQRVHIVINPKDNPGSLPKLGCTR